MGGALRRALVQQPPEQHHQMGEIGEPTQRAGDLAPGDVPAPVTASPKTACTRRGENAVPDANRPSSASPTERRSAGLRRAGGAAALQLGAQGDLAVRHHPVVVRLEQRLQQRREQLQEQLLGADPPVVGHARRYRRPARRSRRRCRPCRPRPRSSSRTGGVSRWSGTTSAGCTAGGRASRRAPPCRGRARRPAPRRWRGCRATARSGHRVGVASRSETCSGRARQPPSRHELVVVGRHRAHLPLAVRSRQWFGTTIHARSWVRKPDPARAI